jgi:hypothetical protein
MDGKVPACSKASRLEVALAHTCRNSLAKSWKLTLDQLKGRVHDTVSH